MIHSAFYPIREFSMWGHVADISQAIVMGPEVGKNALFYLSAKFAQMAVCSNPTRILLPVRFSKKFSPEAIKEWVSNLSLTTGILASVVITFVAHKYFIIASSVLSQGAICGVHTLVMTFFSACIEKQLSNYVNKRKFDQLNEKAKNLILLYRSGTKVSTYLLSVIFITHFYHVPIIATGLATIVSKTAVLGYYFGVNKAVVPLRRTNQPKNQGQGIVANNPLKEPQ